MNRSVGTRMLMAGVMTCLGVFALAAVYFGSREADLGAFLTDWAPIAVAVLAFLVGRTIMHRFALASSPRR